FRRRVEPVFVAIQHVSPSSRPMIVMNAFLIRYPRRGKGNLTESRTYVRHICHRGGQEVYVRAIHLPPTLGFAPDA
ncbi:hypothetical protein EVJ30_13315, partial [Exiguobacterium sp. SH5S13]